MIDINRDSAHQSQNEDNFALRRQFRFTQEARSRVALGYRCGQLLRFFRALQTSRKLHNLIVHVKA